MLHGKELEIFRHTLADLAEINDNPVTILRHWNIPRIPNLLTAYERKIEEERYKKMIESKDHEIARDYLMNGRKKSKC